MTEPKTILIVDDDPIIVLAVSTFLKKHGYHVLTAEDGNKGMALAERAAPDVVLVDMMMPKQSGFLVLQKLKSRREGGPRVIMMTANEGSRHRAYAEVLGVDDYLRKPFAMDQLLDSIRRLCPDGDGEEAK
ncbi:MAG: response regulator transcription factor [Gemmataceae bacterium]